MAVLERGHVSDALRTVVCAHEVSLFEGPHSLLGYEERRETQVAVSGLLITGQEKGQG